MTTTLTPNVHDRCGVGWANNWMVLGRKYANYPIIITSSVFFCFFHENAPFVREESEKKTEMKQITNLEWTTSPWLICCDTHAHIHLQRYANMSGYGLKDCKIDAHNPHKYPIVARHHGCCIQQIWLKTILFSKWLITNGTIMYECMKRQRIETTWRHRTFNTFPINPNWFRW